MVGQIACCAHNLTLVNGIRNLKFGFRNVIAKNAKQREKHEIRYAFSRLSRYFVNFVVNFLQ
jgi:hypothetical protein